jgi:hypothetical protein
MDDTEEAPPIFIRAPQDSSTPLEKFGSFHPEHHCYPVNRVEGRIRLSSLDIGD